LSVFTFSARNPVFVNMLMIAIVLLGIHSFVTLPREIQSEINFNWVFIVTVYPGASPEEVEKYITIPIEDEISDVEDIDLLSSHSGENSSVISVKFVDMRQSLFDKRFNDLRVELDKVQDLPEDAEDPTIFQLKTSTWLPALNVVLSGDLPEIEMKRIAEDLRRRILDLEEVSKVEVAGEREREIWIEVDPDRINASQIALLQVAEAIRAKNLNLPAGRMRSGETEYVVRTIGELHSAEELAGLTLFSHPETGKVSIGDLADVRDTLAETRTLSRFDGQKSITLSVSKKTKGNVIRLSDQVKSIVREVEETLPRRAKISITSDYSVSIREILSKLQTNALLGFALVVALLYMLLGARNALFAGLGIPVTLLSAFLFMRVYGESFNGNSLFALVLVLGMLVDDAVVVVENCHRYMQKGLSPYEAVRIGAPEVAIPVLASVLTTMAAFLPLMLMPGIIGAFMRIIPIVVCMALAASLFEAFVVLPAHIAHWGRPGSRGLAQFDRFFGGLRNRYGKILVKILRRRYLVVGLVVVLALVSAGMIPLIGVDMFPEEDVSLFFVNVRMPVGTKLSRTDEVVKRIEDLCLNLPPEELDGVVGNVGILQHEEGVDMETSVGQVIVDLTPENRRKRTIDQITAGLRARTETIPGVTSIDFTKVSGGPPTGSPVEIRVKGKYLDTLDAVAEEVKNELRTMPGVYDVRDDFVPGKEEVKVVVEEDKAAALGLNTYAIARTIRTALAGDEISSIMDGDEEVGVILKLPEEWQEDITNLESLVIKNRDGDAISLKNVAHFVITRTYSEVYRFERDRAITVRANVDREKTSAVEATARVEESFTHIQTEHPGYSLDFRGEFEEFRRAFSSLGRLFLVGILLIFVILGAQFRSWLQPLIVIVTVPFAFIGATFGLLVSGYPFSVISLFGMVGLAGVAVNSAIVLIDFINKTREKGVDPWFAIVRSAKIRLRPILLTSTTTVFGLLPMALGLGGRSATWQPLASTIVFGLAVGTGLTLFVIPAVYGIYLDLTNRFGRLMRQS
jgi:multidrug efflux pump subunit AcrB